MCVKSYTVQSSNVSMFQKVFLMISNWRQGASFIQEIVGSHPFVLKIYEPLILYKTIFLMKLRNWYQEPGSEQYIKDMLQCKWVPSIDKVV